MEHLSLSNEPTNDDESLLRGQWDLLTGFDQNDPDRVVWQATERLTPKEAENRLAWLTEQAPERQFRIAQIPIAL